MCQYSRNRKHSLVFKSLNMQFGPGTDVKKPEAQKGVFCNMSEFTCLCHFCCTSVHVQFGKTLKGLLQCSTARVIITTRVKRASFGSQKGISDDYFRPRLYICRQHRRSYLCTRHADYITDAYLISKHNPRYEYLVYSLFAS